MIEDPSSYYWSELHQDCIAISIQKAAPFSRLASGPTALPPKSEVIFERTLKETHTKTRVSSKYANNDDKTGHGVSGIRIEQPDKTEILLRGGGCIHQRTNQALCNIR